MSLRTVSRLLIKNPKISVPTVIILGFGICTCALTFAVFDAIVWRALPYPHPDRLIAVQEVSRRAGTAFPLLPLGVAEKVKTSVASLTTVGYFSPGVRPVMVRVGKSQSMLPSADVSPDFFRALGVEPIIGRNFTVTDSTPGARPVAVLGYTAWRDLFGSHPDVIGQEIAVNGAPHVIVGILPRNFRFFGHYHFEIYLPEVVSDKTAQNSAFVIGRLRRSVDLGALNSELRTISPRIANTGKIEALEGGVYLSAVELRARVLGSLRHALDLLLLAAILVQILVCVNVGILLLAHSDSRRFEVSVRTALGASPEQIARQFLGESLGLALGGCAVGLLLSWCGVGYLQSLLTPKLWHGTTLTLSPLVLGLTLGLSLASGLAFGALPAIRLSRQYPALPGRVDARRYSRFSRHWRPESLLITWQIATSVVFLVAFGLLFQSLLKLTNVRLGFEAIGLTAINVLGVLKQNDTHSILNQVRNLPGVEEAAFGSTQPLGGGTIFMMFGVETETNGWVMSPYIATQLVSHGYFRTMEIPVIKGRAFGSQDQKGRPMVAVVSSSLAETLWPGGDPLNQKIDLNFGIGKPALARVVGVVGDVADIGLGRTPGPEMYFLHSQFPANGSSVLLIRGPGTVTLAEIKTIIGSVDRGLVLTGIAKMADILKQTFFEPTLRAVLSGVLGLLGLGITLVGLFAMVSHDVNRRRREIGIRLTFGATPRSATWTIFSRYAVLVAVGELLGVIGAVWATHLLRAELFETSLADLGVYVAAIAISASVLALSVLLTARKAGSISPAELMRQE